MLILNRRDPDFDEAMELLCTLPRDDKGGAPLALLTKDFGYATQDGVRRLINQLVERGFDIRIHPSHKQTGMVVGIGGSGWRMAKSAGNAYWDKVNAP
jgi:hypothetical protein